MLIGDLKHPVLSVKQGGFFGNLILIGLYEKEISPNVFQGECTGIQTDKLFISDPDILCEYIDLLYPYPTLVPYIPLHRAQYRAWIYEIYYTLLPILSEYNQAKPNRQKEITKILQDFIYNYAAHLEYTPYLFGEDISFIELCLANILMFYREIPILLNESHVKLMGLLKKILNRKSIRSVYQKHDN